jgi:hypothetical protein
MKIKNDSFNGLTVQHWPANVHEQGCLFVDGFSAHIGPPGQTGPKILYVFKLMFEPHVGRVYFLLATTDLLLQLCFQFLVGVEKKPKY